jgi:hypothetical protein
MIVLIYNQNLILEPDQNSIGKSKASEENAYILLNIAMREEIGSYRKIIDTN